MNHGDDPRGKLPEGQLSSSEEVEQLKTQIQDMQLELDILKETLDVLKKDPGVDMTVLRNKEKAVIIDALRNKYSLPILLQKLEISKSSYYYQHKQVNLPDKYEVLRIRIIELFNENFGIYGYRRIHALLSREGTSSGTYRPWLPLPLARMDLSDGESRFKTFYVKERVFPRQFSL